MVINRPKTASAHEIRTEPFLVRWTLITIAILFLTIFVVLPLIVVFTEAFSKGVGAYLSALSDPEALSAIRLTLTIAAISVPTNAAFGIAAAWLITKFDFRGKALLITLIDLPFSVSPSSPTYASCWFSAPMRRLAAGWCRRDGRWSLPFRGSCWPRCSSPFPSSRAS